MITKIWAKLRDTNTIVIIPKLDFQNIKDLGNNNVLLTGTHEEIITSAKAIDWFCACDFYTSEMYLQKGTNALTLQRLEIELQMATWLDMVADSLKDGNIYFEAEHDHQPVKPRQICHYPISILELSLKNMLDMRGGDSEYNADRKHTYRSSIVKTFFLQCNEIKEAFNKGNFVQTFEVVNILIAYLNSKHKYFDYFLGDKDLGLILNAIALKLSSAMYDCLQEIETENKQLFINRYKLL